ncbi:PLC-like phosphodiesterase [Mycena kentingensis (nom. inval.)]|nr:PLC-like phosphodiesterase [Mycena kentingensis (nom. inval.)]
MLGHLALLLLSAFSVNAATTCNGHAELCDKTFGNVTFVGAHNSYAVGVNNLAANQDQDVTQQLNDGIRMLQMQAHNQSGTIQLCHSNCLLYNGGTLQDYLTKVKSWMDSNTEDVVSLLIVNIDNLAPSRFAEVFEATGLDKLSYSPSSSSLSASSWPTLGSMIDGNTRLVTFLDNSADTSVVSYLIDEFTNVWETAYDLTDVSLFDCTVNRTKGDTATQMYLINHFLDKMVFGSPAPDIDAANVTNSASGTGSLGAHVDTCAASQGRAPNFLLLDYYEYASSAPLSLAASLNGVTYNPTSPIATPVSTSSAAASATNTGSATSLALFLSSSQVTAALFVGAGIALGIVNIL